MHVKPQISKFKAEKSCHVGFNVSRRLYWWTFFKRVKSFVHVSVSSVCIYALLTTVVYAFRTDDPYFKFSPNSPWAMSSGKILHTNENANMSATCIHMSVHSEADDKRQHLIRSQRSCRTDCRQTIHLLSQVSMLTVVLHCYIVYKTVSVYTQK